MHYNINPNERHFGKNLPFHISTYRWAYDNEFVQRCSYTRGGDVYYPVGHVPVHSVFSVVGIRNSVDSFPSKINITAQHTEVATIILRA